MNVTQLLAEAGIAGELPAYAWPGGYPMYYLDGDNCVLCPSCANRDRGSVVAWGIEEDAETDLDCDECSRPIK